MNLLHKNLFCDSLDALTGNRLVNTTKPPRMVVGNSGEIRSNVFTIDFQPATSRGGFSFGGVVTAFSEGASVSFEMRLPRTGSPVVDIERPRQPTKVWRMATPPPSLNAIRAAMAA